MLAIDAIDDVEVGQIGHVYRGLHEIAEMEPRGGQHFAQVLHYAPRLMLYPALRQPPARWVDSDLSRAEHPFARHDCLRIGTDRGRRRGRRNLMFHRWLPKNIRA